jgi:hypothetical protein
MQNIVITFTKEPGMAKLIENSTANDRVVPSAPANAPQSTDSGTVLTIISKAEMTQLGVPMTIGDPANPHVGDVANMRSMQVPFNGTAGGNRKYYTP